MIDDEAFVGTFLPSLDLPCTYRSQHYAYTVRRVNYGGLRGCMRLDERRITEALRRISAVVVHII